MPPKSSPRMSIPFTYPTREEAYAAQRACCGRVCTLCESPAQYAWRKRDVDLSYLVQQAMQRELSASERGVLEQYWFERESLSEIARHNGCSPAAAHKTLRRAMQKLERALWYVLQYQHDLQQPHGLLPLAVQRAMAVCAARQLKPRSFSEQLKALRIACNLPLADTACALRLSEKRLREMENAAAEPTLRELLSLAAFYDLSLDTLVKGVECHEAKKQLLRPRDATYGANALAL